VLSIVLLKHYLYNCNIAQSILSMSYFLEEVLKNKITQGES